MKQQQRPLEARRGRRRVHPTHFLSFCLSAEGTDSVRLSEIYSKLDEIEADKAPARYLWQPGTAATLQENQLSSGHVSVL